MSSSTLQRRCLRPAGVPGVLSFEFKIAAVQRFLMGENKIGLSKELRLSSPALISKRVRLYRDEGENGIRPKPKAGRREPGNRGQP
ncbi:MULTISPECIES: helix-turn-helix domain-containing protein [unclassified Arthrobacter]|uniref:helix-turn-helix domain-containing protein n=1 Tax=unclassified Arthrobacter TaxID=235627 RepID=UPI001C84CA67|nr:transposase [Arthrobacter sp. MAHUQ-56]MBX7445447.1 transposase [Arthrobacter sp. MAHUQ-56]